VVNYTNKDTPLDLTTGLYKPQELEERFLYETQKIVRYGDEKGLEMSLLFIKLEGLGAINESVGWIVGDRILMETTKTLNTLLRSMDSASRVGRTSFAVLLPETKLANIPQILQKLEHSLNALLPSQVPLAKWHFGWTLYESGTALDSNAFWNSFLSKNGVMKGWSSA